MFLIHTETRKHVYGFLLVQNKCDYKVCTFAMSNHNRFDLGYDVGYNIMCLTNELIRGIQQLWGRGPAPAILKLDDQFWSRNSPFQLILIGEPSLRIPFHPCNEDTTLTLVGSMKRCLQ